MGIFSDRIGQQAYSLDRWKVVQKKEDVENVDP
jgi:hypothetical protein